MMAQVSGKSIKSLFIASKQMNKVISFSFDPKCKQFIPVLDQKKCKSLLEIYTYFSTVREFTIELSKLGYAFNAIDYKLAVESKLEEYKQFDWKG